jgi:hypothetical protein
VPRLDGFHGLGVLGLAVLDVLGLVEHDGVEFQSAIFSASRRINA